MRTFLMQKMIQLVEGKYCISYTIYYFVHHLLYFEAVTLDDSPDKNVATICFHFSSNSRGINGKADEPEEPRTPPIIIASKDDYYDG